MGVRSRITTLSEANRYKVQKLNCTGYGGLICFIIGWGLSEFYVKVRGAGVISIQ